MNNAGEGYPFSDLTLARRLEKAEALANVDFVKGRARTFPDRGAEWIELGGTYAMFDGPQSPVTQTFGLGMFQPVTSADFNNIQTFFHNRGADVFHEVCPLADSSALPLLNERGYQPVEFTSVLYRPITADLSLSTSRNQLIRVRHAESSEHELWARTAAEGWGAFGQLADFMHELGVMNANRSSLSFLAELDGKAIASASMNIFDGVALLAGASTIPEGRRQGAQLALLEFRLRHAAKQGCDIALMGALPGSASQRNAERNGFRIAYTRTKWHLPQRTKI